jgi:rubrerythrin
MTHQDEAPKRKEFLCPECDWIGSPVIAPDACPQCGSEDLIDLDFGDEESAT